MKKNFKTYLFSLLNKSSGNQLFCIHFNKKLNIINNCFSFCLKYCAIAFKNSLKHISLDKLLEWFMLFYDLTYFIKLYVLGWYTYIFYVLHGKTAYAELTPFVQNTNTAQ